MSMHKRIEQCFPMVQNGAFITSSLFISVRAAHTCILGKFFVSLAIPLWMLFQTSSNA
jgi:hypothetical protein